MDHAQHEAAPAGGHQPAMAHSSFFSTAMPSHLLFESWRISNMFDYTISCLIVAAMSIFWMWIRVQRATQESKLQKGRPLAVTQRAIIASMFTVELALGYLLMLVTMTMNKGLFCSVILGAGLGHFLLLDSVRHNSGSVLDGNCH